MKIQLTIKKLEAIIEMAKGFQKIDDSLSETLTFELLSEKDTWLGSDTVRVEQKSWYGECQGKYLLMAP